MATLPAARQARMSLATPVMPSLATPPKPRVSVVGAAINIEVRPATPETRSRRHSTGGAESPTDMDAAGEGDLDRVPTDTTGRGLHSSTSQPDLRGFCH
jgi:hypothetical protein